MKLLTVFIYFISIQLLVSNAYAVDKNKGKTKPSTSTCSSDEVAKFKAEYIKLQNALKYEGKDIELKAGKSLGVGEDTDAENSPGKKVEQILYNQYKNALIKVGKIYQQINNDPNDGNKKLLKDNPDLTRFFKAIDPKNTDRKISDSLNVDALLEKLKKVQIKGFELKDEDIYLLKKLVTHSQDRICTLEKYKNNKSGSKTAYLEQFSKSPLNKMIESLKSLSGDQDLQLANEDIAISEAIKGSIAQLRKIVKENKSCETKLMNSPLLGDVVQTCNYNKFIKSISVNQFNEIESILHFINANQNAKNARTGLDWINTQFSIESKTSCLTDPDTKAIYIQNFPLKDGKKVDSSKLSCLRGSTQLKGEECVKGLSFDSIDKLGTKVSLKKDAPGEPLTSFSIKDAENCLNVALPTKDPEPVAPPASNLPASCDKEVCLKLTAPGVVAWKDSDKSCYSTFLGDGKPDVKLCSEASLTPEQECKKDSKKEWKDNKCIDLAPPLQLTEAECKKDPKKEWKDNKCIDLTPPLLMTEAECKKDPKKDWKDGKCVDKTQTPVVSTDKEKCEKADQDWIKGAVAPDIRTSRYSWDEGKKACNDKQAPKPGSKEEEMPEAKPEVVYPNKPVPGRFQPISIPTRKVYILPGMP